MAERFGDEADPDRLLFDWSLSEADLQEIRRARGGDNRLWTALHLCNLRRTGRFVDDVEQVPHDAVIHLVRQLGAAFPVRLAPLARQPTDSAIRARVRVHLGFVPFSVDSQDRLEADLSGVAADGSAAADLVQRAEALLCAAKVVLPARPTLERLVASIVRQALERLYNSIAARLPPPMCEALDRLVGQLAGEAEAGTHGRASLGRYRTPSAASMGRFTREARQRLEEIGGMLTDLPDLGDVSQLIRRQFAQLCRRYDGRALRRFPRDKRYSLLVCFLVDRRQGLLDEMVQAHDTHMTGLMRRARHAAEAEARRLRRAADDGLLTLLDTGKEVLVGDNEESVAGLRRRLGVERLQGAVTACEAVATQDSRGVIDAVLARYPDLRKSLPDFLSLPFVSDTGQEALLHAIALVRQLDDGELKTLPEDAPTDFVPAAWRRVLRDDRGRLRRSVWETALALAVRDALRSGDLYLAESRRHAGFWSLVLNEQTWAAARAVAYADLGLSERPADHLIGLALDITQAARAFADGLATNDFADIERGQLRLRRPDMLPLSPEVRQLRRDIESRMPRVRIEDVLLEVDRRCGFIRAFRPLAGYEPRAGDTYRALLATLVAHGTNLGLTAMGDSVEGLTAADLQQVSRWLVRDSTLKAANAQIVEHLHRLDFANVWGDGHLSSSDGQRFRAPPGTLIGAYHPRYFGHYDKAVTVYTHVSQRIGVFSTQLMSCAPREATYVLDGLLDNDTSLDPRLHTTDTHGFTEPLWGLCHLLGIDFMPRLKDLADQRLWLPDGASPPEVLTGVFAGTIDAVLIREQWDQLVRIAASLKARTAPAHVVLQRLTAGGPSDRVAKALAALGRLVKTRNILRYLHDAQLRRAIQAQLNRGESRHALARWLFFANQGEFRTGDYEAMMNKASCLGLLSNAMVLWNTLQMERIVADLRSGGMLVPDEHLAHVWPLQRRQVVPNGVYFVNRTMPAFALPDPVDA
ncbi:MAG: Tn3 family transposase [Alphaproteobacteria bacterium]|nr:Tn3 family transposase [Alphaproteobacteria bacterium]